MVTAAGVIERERAAAGGGPRIERVEIRLVNLEPRSRRSDAIQSFVVQETPIVQVFADDGAAGTGYVFAIGTGGAAVVEMIARHLAPRLIGRDPTRIEAIWHDLHRHTHATTVGPITALALSTIDMALWDMRARRAGRPIHVELGGGQPSIPLYATEGGWLQLPKDILVANALRAKDAGFRGFKVKIGRPIHEDVARLAAVRTAVGDAFEIMIDGNQSATVDEAIRRARLFEPFDLAWYEEPMPAEDLGGHARLSASTSLPIAIGESIYSLQHFREYLRRDAASVVQVCVARIGGVTPWLKAVHLAEAFNVKVAPHFLMEAHVGLGCGVPNVSWVEYIPQLEAITTGAIRIEDGCAVPPETPGLGIEWDWSAIDGRQAGMRVVTAAA